MSELEAAMVELNAAIERGEVTQEDLDADMDLQEDAESDEQDSSDDFSMVESEADFCKFACFEGILESSTWKPRPKKGHKPTANGWYAEFIFSELFLCAFRF
jgi:hypothetical protein